jgi:hypothetical protein
MRTERGKAGGHAPRISLPTGASRKFAYSLKG